MSLHTTNNKQQDKPILYIYLARHDTDTLTIDAVQIYPNFDTDELLYCTEDISKHNVICTMYMLD